MLDTGHIRTNREMNFYILDFQYAKITYIIVLFRIPISNRFNIFDAKEIIIVVFI